MKDLFYIYLEKDKTGFYRLEEIDFDQQESFRFENYNKVIQEKFKKIESYVRLNTGNFKTNVFIPKDDKIEIYFCLVNKNFYPVNSSKTDLTSKQRTAIKSFLNKKISQSEGIFPENRIDIKSQFVTPFCRFDDSKVIHSYHSKLFEKNTIIFGPPGSGKTTILRMIAIDKLRNFIENEEDLDRLPIYIQLRNFNSSNINLERFINNSIANNCKEYKLFSNEKYLSSGKLLLLLDGADEIDFEKFKEFPKSIKNYKNKFPYISFVISSRPDRNFKDISSFRKCYLEPFSNQQIKELTYKKLANTGKWKDFISILDVVPEITDILRNPLLLSISHFLFSRKSILPLNTGQLLKELVNALVSSWDSQRNIERRLGKKSVNPNEIINMLGKLSIILMESGKIRANPAEIFNKFPSFNSRESFIEFLEYVDFATSLIKYEDDYVEFTHKSIQDYFCSNFLVESVKELNQDIFINKNWEKVLKMISGISSDPNYLIEELLSNNKIDNHHKINNTLLMFSESPNLSKYDLENSFNKLEEYFLEFELKNKVSNMNVNSNSKEVLMDLMTSTKGFKELLVLLRAIVKIRFTKYEYDFNGYLRNSKSTILKSLEALNSEKGRITFFHDKKNLTIKNEDIQKGN